MTDVTRDTSPAALPVPGPAGQADEMAGNSFAIIASTPRSRRLVDAARRAYVDIFVDEWGPRRWMRARLAAIFVLCFLIWPVKAMLRSDSSLPYKMLVLAGLMAFGLCFLAVIWRNTPRLHANRAPYAVVAAIAIGSALLAVYGRPWLSAITYFTIAMLLFNCRTSRWPYIVVGVPLAQIVVGRYLMGDHTMAPFSLAIQACLIGVIQAAFYQQITAKIELRRVRADLARLAVSEERLRISRDLHDILGQQLSAVSLKADLAARLASRDPERAAAEMIEVAAVARAALSEVRETVSGYRQMSMCGETETGRAILIAARVHVNVSICQLPHPLDQCGAWLVREAVTNVIRHSGASNCEIKAVRTPTSVVIEVRDDGGTEGAALAYGTGLTGLAERVENERGDLFIGRERGWFVVRATFGEAAVRSAAGRAAAAIGGTIGGTIGGAE